jgi:peroxin-1
MAPKRVSTPAVELALVHLRNCLVNLPPPLVVALANSNTVSRCFTAHRVGPLLFNRVNPIKAVQNVVVELQYRSPTASAKGTQPIQQSIYVGWTGMASQKRPAPPAVRGTAINAPKESDSGVVELDASFGRTMGFADGQKVRVFRRWVSSWPN